MNLKQIRQELNNYDNILKTLIALRMSLIPIVTEIKVKENLPFFQSNREKEIFEKIDEFSKNNGADNNLIKSIYKNIMTTAVSIEEKIADNSQESVLNKQNINFSNMESINDDFKKLDNILENDIPNIILSINQKCKENGLNLSEIATLYYFNKLNELD